MPIRVRVVPPVVPEGRRLEDIRTVDDVSPAQVDGWLVAEEEDARKEARKDDLRAGLWGIAVCALAIFGFRQVPSDWLDRPISLSLVLLVLAAAVGGLGAVELWTQLEARRWLPTPCRILATTIRGGGQSWAPAVFFEYQVDGRAFRSDFVSVAGPVSGAEEANRRRMRFSPGESRTCYYNPKDHSKAVLERSVSFRQAGPLLGVALGAVAAAVIL